MATAPMLAAPHSSAALLHWLDLLPQEHRLASRSPIPGSGLEHAGERRSTIHAAPLLDKIPAGEFEPVAADQQPATAAAPGAAARPVMNIACIDISQAVGAADIAGARQARSGSCQGARVASPIGKRWTQANIGNALVGREIARHLRELGANTRGPLPLTKCDRSRLLSALDTALEAALRESVRR